MFSNERKTIGLFIFNTHGDFQSEVCRGMAHRTAELGYNLAIFSSYGTYGINMGYNAGEMNIFDLPDYSQLAGLVLAMDTINIVDARNGILERVRERASCPVVSLREQFDWMNNILIDEVNSMEGIVRHVIETHGKKDIAFMTGYKGRYDAEQRLACYRRIMAEYGYPVSEHRTFYGDFWKNKGKDALDWFLEDGKYPEAIICANDHMAMAVIDELFARGMSVPEDVIVTGYDGLEEGIVYSPSLTSVNVDFTEMAYTAVDIIDRHQEDPSLEDVYVATHIIQGDSCGCLSVGKTKTTSRRCANHKKIATKDSMEMQYSFMTIDFSEIHELHEVHEVIARYIGNIESLQNYYICLREDIEEEGLEMKGYSDTMHARLAFRDKKDMGVVDFPFGQKQLLPEELTGEEPQCYFFYPLHFQERCFGYEAYRFHEYSGDIQNSVRWNIAVSNAIESILDQSKMNNLISELENMYIQDVLTGLYNRRGFEKYARMQFSKARAKDSLVCVIGIDMDGLKPINDIYGHHEGDSALRAVGYAIQEAAMPGQIGARIGGDEFEVIFPCEGEQQVVKWCKVFEQSLKNYNIKSMKPYDVYASWGYKLGVPTANDTIESYMNESDDIMYRNKLANKKKRNEELR